MVKSKIKVIFRIVFGVAILLPGITVVNYLVMSTAFAPRIFSNIGDLPENATILVFGAGRNYPSDNVNFWFNGRMNATEKIYRNYHPTEIVLSGKTESPHYKEAVDMKRELVRRGLPEKILVIDSMGSDTKQSVVNIKPKALNGKVIFISQREHLERALFYADHYEVDAYGYSAKGIPAEKCIYFNVREYAARLKARMEILL